MYSGFCSQSSVLPLESVSYDICCDLPAARVFASSVLKGNGQSGLFMCRSMLGLSQWPPPLWPHSPKPSSGQENLGSHPLLLCHSHSLFFFFKMLRLAGTAQPASKQTAESTLSTLRTYCTAKQFHTENFDLIGMKHEDSREDKKGVCVVLRGHVGKIW